MRKLYFVLLLGCSVLYGQAIKVGSKAGIESVILGALATELAERHQLTADHKAGLGGTQVVWKALLRGDIDLYAEYTGTLAQELLVGKNVTDLESLRRALAPLDLLAAEPLGFNNSYAIGVTKKTAERLKLTKISDLEKFPELKFGFSHEFMDRKEGWPALKGLYGLPQPDVRGMEHEVTYLGVSSGAIDAMDLYTTDAEIKYYDLVALQDDRHLFPQYEALFIYRKRLETAEPKFIAALKGLSGKISQEKMTQMNAAVKIDKLKDRTVVASFLDSQGTEKNARSVVAEAPLWTYTKQHLHLVLLSLALTIVVAVPLGVVAALRPALGEVILALSGIIQTIPSLALLVFMIPFLGIGPRPALMALFLYGLLPILRNTYTGLRDIPPSLLESAEALGLPRWVRLLKIELPLASRSILAGIKTSAVINVGTATLGAIIGAGGYGEPILMGIRRDDVGLILQGAIPSALLAIAVQLLFELSEKYFTPRGLRLSR